MSTTKLGSKQASAWQAYITYDIVETKTSVTINYTAGLYVYQNSIVPTKAYTCAVALNGTNISSGSIGSGKRQGIKYYPITTSSRVFQKGINSKTHSISVKTVASTGTTSSLTFNLTVKALEMAKATLSAVRNANDPTKADLLVTITSYEGDEISGCYASVNGGMATNVGQGVIGESGTLLLTRTITIPTNVDSTITINTISSLGESETSQIIPKVSAPTVTATVTRSPDDRNQIIIRAVVSTFGGDSITYVRATIGTTVINLGSGVATSGELIKTTVVDGVDTGTLLVSVVANGLGGLSNEATVAVASAFTTLSFAEKDGVGKVASFGEDAKSEMAEGHSNGILNVKMDANFKGNTEFANVPSGLSDLFKVITVEYNVTSDISAHSYLNVGNVAITGVPTGYSPLCVVGYESGRFRIHPSIVCVKGTDLVLTLANVSDVAVKASYKFTTYILCVKN